jgi:hypothetical protein
MSYEAIRSLIQSIPQIMVMAFITRLLYNELLHIVVEPLRVEEKVTDEQVIEKVRRYNQEYGGPASWADVVFDFSPEPLRRMVDRWWESEEGRRVAQQVREVLERLASQGRLRRVEGGYVAG